MEGPPARRSRVGLPLGLLGMLLLVGSVERWLSRLDLDLMAPWHWDWRLTSKATRREAVRAELLCVGDSLVKFSVVPKILQERTGRRVFNLGLCRGQAASTYFTFRRALDAGARPEAVLVDFAPHILITDVRSNDFLWPHMLEVREALDLAWTSRDAGLFASIALGRFVPSIRMRSEVRTDVVGALAGRPTGRRFESPKYTRNWHVNQGAIIFPAGSTVQDAAEMYGNFFARWRPDPVSLVYVHRFFSLAAARKIPVYWLLPPAAPELQELCRRGGFEAQETAFARSIASQYAGVTLLDARHSAYVRTSHMFDLLHLNLDGAVSLSDDLGTVLRRSLPKASGSPGWVRLPRYRKRDFGIEIEDAVASGHRLGGEKAVRR